MKRFKVTIKKPRWTEVVGKIFYFYKDTATIFKYVSYNPKNNMIEWALQTSPGVFDLEDSDWVDFEEEWEAIQSGHYIEKKDYEV